jgi:hypothetical protein
VFQPPVFPPGMDQGPLALKKTLFWGRRRN